MAAGPVRIVLRAYNVGFGDCLLAIFQYGDGSERFVLTDFGTRERAAGAKPTQMVDIATDIKQRCKGQLDAIVVSHRHLDHNNGFTGASFNLIASCSPRLVVQPWTETPGLASNATKPSKRLKAASSRHAATLHRLNETAESITSEIAMLRRHAGREMRRSLDEIEVVGLNNVKNAAAVQNLANLGGKKNSLYLYYGASAKRLADLLPGVKVDVLGPPTPDMDPDIVNSTATSSQFWMLTAGAREHAAAATAGDRAKWIFRGAKTSPVGFLERRTVESIGRAQSETLRGIVSVVDDAINNTSLILVMRIGASALLFPGDAQIENWSWALDNAKNHLANRSKLKTVKLYKVGHHGSRNATPHELWDLFERRRDLKGKTDPLRSVMSTKEGVYPGTPGLDTEVPRASLVEALQQGSELTRTDRAAGDALFVETTVDLG